MSLTASPRELHDRLSQATAVSTVARERATRAVAAALGVHARASRVRLDSIAARVRRGADATPEEIALGEIALGTHDPRSVHAFRIAGVVDGVPAYARWTERGLECSPTLLPRIEIVVALGETFDPGGGRPVVHASLDGPLKAVLPTVIRAFSRVTSIELAVHRSSPPLEPS